MRTPARAVAALATAALLFGCASAQTNAALGRSVDIDFSEQSDSFTSQGPVSYGSDGASFTITKSGDSPKIESKWYIMFGKVEFTMKASPGAGIVSSAILQSDDLDEIDWEWLGSDADEVQTNYFGKGQTTTYNRGAFHADAGSQTGFKTYTIEWTAEELVWQIDGVTVRALKPADASGQYPQTPMQIKIGSWAGGDTDLNSPGTVEWARGPTDYSQGPFTMQLKSLAVTDYSTGTQYKYGDSSGTWQSIVAVDGTVNSGGSNVDSAAPAVTSSSSGQPIPWSGTHDSSSTYVRPSVYPWVPESTTLATASTQTATSYPGLPSGWTVTSSGKVVPPSSAPSTSPPASPTSLSAASRPDSSSAGDTEVLTTFDQHGFTTVVTVAAGAAKSDYWRGVMTAAPDAQKQSAETSGSAAPSPTAAGGSSRAGPVWLSFVACFFFSAFSLW
ncbi:glycoside hydrolase family 16 protein [Diplodia corticola]|uniref:Crh-like protein n=1 Tax=Diplodia corticola TaxID=236234 RepID=A0A1J9RXD4_9PEZI|nr:glycoside hydrolase family 16 protein [Diplodia corticola]OJD32492.1 glycoside hydrolase family 16 protein [Diplodia corticola]